jgi:hypothetical protein
MVASTLERIPDFEERLVLLGNCFWREGFEAAFGPDRMGEKGGCYKRSFRKPYWSILKKRALILGISFIARKLLFAWGA